MLKIARGLFHLDVSNYRNIMINICRQIMTCIDGIKFVSIFTYNKNDETIIYQEIEYRENNEFKYDRNKLAKLLEDNIVLEIDESVSGILISSNDYILKIDDVMIHKSYKSKQLADFLGLKKAIFLKIMDLRRKNVYGLVAIYPEDGSLINKWNNEQFYILISIIENIISNSNLIRDDKILAKIFSAAIKNNDLTTFLNKCINIISNEIMAKGCSIFVVDPIDNLVKLKATMGVKPGRKNKYINEPFTDNDVFYEIGEGMTGNIVLSKQAVIINKVDTTESKWIDLEESNTFVAVPILSFDQERVIGIIRCTTKPNNLLGSAVDSFNQEDVDLLKYVASLISNFMEIYFYQENQKQMITKMPHELTASLGNIKSVCDYLDLMNKKINNSGLYINWLSRKICDIRQEANLSLMTVGSVSVFEKSKDEYNYEYLDIFKDIIAKVRKMLNPVAIKDRSIEIKYDNSDNFPKMYLDKYKIQMVFHNLLINAIKYSYPQESVKQNKKILITGRRNIDNTSYVISVSNYGIAIPVGKVDDIFINGVRALEAIKIDPGGKGFGLALVKNILLMHGAEIKVASINNPTVFDIIFPSEIVYISPELTNKGGRL